MLIMGHLGTLRRDTGHLGHLGTLRRDTGHLGHLGTPKCPKETNPQNV